MHHSSVIVQSLVFLFWSLFIAAADPAATPSDARALLFSGDFAGARSLIEKEYREHPSDPETALLYAKTMQNAAQALDLFKKIAVDTLFPDSIRGEAYFRLGTAAYLKGRFQKAGGYLKKAVLFSKDQAIIAARGLNAVHDTADSVGINSLKQQAADTSSYEGKISNYFLGILYFSKKDYAASLAHFTASAGSSDTLWWSCASYAGAYCSAVSLGRNEEAAAILTHLKRIYPQFLEKALVSKAKPVSAAAPVRKDTTAWLQKDTAAVKKETKPTAAKVSAQKSTFSLQVGAFGSAQNAGTLKADLAKRYSPVSVVAALVQDKPIYRVRVGVFGSRETAQAFGDSVLAKKGLQFRIVEDVPVE
jgi:tetratricopeptide (TPR) repeat protein